MTSRAQIREGNEELQEGLLAALRQAQDFENDVLLEQKVTERTKRPGRIELRKQRAETSEKQAES